MKWIGVKDELPEDPAEYFKRKSYLVCDDSGAYFATYAGAKRWYNSSEDRTEPTHWWPLPETLK